MTPTLYARGVRQLTTEERDYYQAVTKLCRAQTPSRPSTTFPSSSLRPSFPRVMDDLTESHPLLSKINLPLPAVPSR